MLSPGEGRSSDDNAYPQIKVLSLRQTRFSFNQPIYFDLPISRSPLLEVVQLIRFFFLVGRELHSKNFLGSIVSPENNFQRNV